METKVNVEVKNDNPIITILEGNALTPRERKPINISGAINSPKEYARVNGIDRLNDYIEYSRKNMTIILRKNASNELGDTITGTLKINPDLANFKINENCKKSPKEYASFLKMNKIFFSDREEHMKIVSGLMNFQAKINTEIEKESDNRGNKKDVVLKKITTEIPTEFYLQIPIFVGQESKKFKVEIGIDYSDGNGIHCWLESEEMNNIIIEERDLILDSEIKAIMELGDCPIIEI
jgi:hypothetical protein